MKVKAASFALTLALLLGSTGTAWAETVAESAADDVILSDDVRPSCC